MQKNSDIVSQDSVRIHITESFMRTFPELRSGFTGALKRIFYYSGGPNLQELLITISSLMNPVRNIAIRFLNIYFNVIFQFMSNCTFELKTCVLVSCKNMAKSLNGNRK
jgi:hypothetical protein